MKKEYRLPVRGLVEFALRSGDIDSTFSGGDAMERAQEGGRVHRRIQKQWRDRGIGTEVYLSHTTQTELYDVTVEGRADGIDATGELPAVLEIKTLDQPLEGVDEDFSPLHWAQGICYAYFYVLEHQRQGAVVRLLYYSVETGEEKELSRSFSFQNLEDYYRHALEEYCRFLSLSHGHQSLRDDSIRALEFPFPAYRRGQRQLAGEVYRTIAAGKKLYARAPTGIGKTISTLFPAVKAMGEGYGEKVFYFTSKTTIRQAAADAVSLMRGGGLTAKSILLTAKEKICPNDPCVRCNPRDCAYAAGHYDRINDALVDALERWDSFDADVLLQIARQHRVCPFEAGLDLSLWCDVIIGDYNYLFDPFVALKRFFADEGGDYIFLVDEAHNLVDRGREMYSAQLNKKDFSIAQKRLKEVDSSLARALGSVYRHLSVLPEEDKEMTLCDWPDNKLLDKLDKLDEVSRKFFKRHAADPAAAEYLDTYFSAVRFLKIAQFYDDAYQAYYENSRSGSFLKLFCTDPSGHLRECMKKGRACVLFSATLIPMEYFCRMLGKEEADKVLLLPSAFPPENRQLVVCGDIETTYKSRERYYDLAAKYIHKIFSARQGNYFVFFPSYQYLESVAEIYRNRFGDEHLLLSGRGDTHERREEFLSRFQEGETCLGFCVLGGAFAEGIDLKGGRLIGTIIVGIGLPQVCTERELVAQSFDRREESGFDYAYVYPGMNKVLQAAGRVIRTEYDRGVIVLLDRRFNSPRQKLLFPPEWYPHYVTGIDGIEETLEVFWKAVKVEKSGQPIDK